MSSMWVTVNKVSQARLEEYFAAQCLSALKAKNNDIFIEALEKAPSLVTKVLDDSQTLLHVAVSKGNLYIIELLIAKGANVNAKTAELQTPLHIAAIKGDATIVKLLLNSGAIHSQEDMSGMTPLHCALLSGRVSATEALLSVGSSIVKKTGSMQTPVELALQSKSLLAFAYMAFTGQHNQFAFMLLDAIKDPEVTFKVVNTVFKCGNTLLHLCCENHCKSADRSSPTWNSIATKLLSMGANIRIRNTSSLTPMNILLNNEDKTLLLSTFIHASITKADKVNLSNMNITKFTTPFIQILLSMSLSTIDFRNNQLNLIPAELCDIEDVKIEGNPLLYLPPDYRTFWPKLQKYLRSIRDRANNWLERKIIVVGEEATGKSTLVKCLKSKKAKDPCKENLATDGIDIHRGIPLVFSEDTDTQDVSVSIWDFGGQEIFYPTHQFFLTNNSTYIITFNLENVNAGRIEYWLRQIKYFSCSDSNSVLLVGTHIDSEICSEEHIQTTISILEQRFTRNVYRKLAGIYPVSCKTGKGFPQLKEALLSSCTSETKKSPYPCSFVLFYEYLNTTLCNSHDWIAFDEFQSLAQKFLITGDQLLSAVTFLSNASTITMFYSKKPSPQDIVILKPQWLSTVMSTLITIRVGANWIKNGIISHLELYRAFAEKFPSEVHPSLVKILQHYHIIYPMRGQDKIVIPSLLADSKTNRNAKMKLWPDRSQSIDYIELGRILKFPFLPLGFFARFIVHILHHRFLKVIYVSRNEIIFSNEKEKSQSKSKEIENLSKIYYSEKKCQLLLRFRHYGSNQKVPKRQSSSHLDYLAVASYVFTQISEITNSVIEEHNMNYDMERFIECSHCIRANATPSFLFDYKDIINVIRKKKEFAFCNGIQSPSRLLPIYKLAPDLMFIGMKTFGPEEIVIDKKIGQGGFGIVYKAYLRSAAPKKSFFRSSAQSDIDLNSSSSGSSSNSDSNIIGSLGVSRIQRSISGDQSANTTEKFSSSFSTLRGFSDTTGDGSSSGPTRALPSFDSSWRHTITSHTKPTFTKQPSRKEETSSFIEVALKEPTFTNSTKNDIELVYSEFQQEVSLMSKLDHPNLVKLLGIMQNPTRMVLEFVPFGDLMDFLHPLPDGHKVRISIARDLLPWKLRLLIALDIAKGMLYLQSQNPPIVHRDLRSPNIFLQSFSEDASQVRAKIADFGLSRSVAMSLSGALDNWEWLAPEISCPNLMNKAQNFVADNISYDERSDIYSFAIVCWELATRTLPFSEFRENEKYSNGRGTLHKAKILQDLVEFDLRPSLPPDDENAPPAFIELIKKCWAFYPADRPNFTYIVETLCKILEIDPTDHLKLVEVQQSLFESPHLQNFEAENKFVNECTVCRKYITVMNTMPTESTALSIVSDDEEDSIITRKNDHSGSISGGSKNNSNNNNEVCYTTTTNLWMGFSDGKISHYFKKDSKLHHLETWQAHKMKVNHVLFFDQMLISASEDGGLRCWDLTADDPSKMCIYEIVPFTVKKTLNQLPIRKMSLIPSPTQNHPHLWVATSNSAEIKVIELRLGVVLHSFLLSVGRFGISDMVYHNGHVWISAGSYISLIKLNYQLESNSSNDVNSNNNNNNNSNNNSCNNLNNNNNYLEIFSRFEESTIWEAHEGVAITKLLSSDEKTLRPSIYQVISFTKFANTVLSGDENGNICVWKTDNSNIQRIYFLRSYTGNPVSGLYFSMDYFISCFSNVIIIWDLSDLSPKEEVQAHSDVIHSLEVIGMDHFVSSSHRTILLHSKVKRYTRAISVKPLSWQATRIG